MISPSAYVRTFVCSRFTFTMPDPPQVVSYRYVNEETGDVAEVTMPMPCSPSIRLALDEAMGRHGYRREEPDGRLLLP